MVPLVPSWRLSRGEIDGMNYLSRELGWTKSRVEISPHKVWSSKPRRRMVQRTTRREIFMQSYFRIMRTNLQVPALVRLLPEHTDFVLPNSCGTSWQGVLLTPWRNSRRSCNSVPAHDSVGTWTSLSSNRVYGRSAKGEKDETEDWENGLNLVLTHYTDINSKETANGNIKWYKSQKVR